MLQLVDLLSLDPAVIGPSGIVYSTAPKRGLGFDGADYFVKGPEPEIVFPELVGCLLASRVGLEVATARVCRFNGDAHCGSLKVADLGRNPWPLLTNTHTDLSPLFAAVVVDTWLANGDRNMGNVLVCSAKGGPLRLVMIDYEKSAALRPNPIMNCAAMAPTLLWPTGDLGALAKKRRPAAPPAAPIEAILEMAEKENGVTELLARVSNAYMPVDWVESSAQVLVDRGKKIRELVREVWTQA